MDIVISVAAKIAEFTVEPIGRQVGYLLCYKSNLKELKDQAEELQTTKERIDLKVEADERNLREIHGDVIRWRQGVIKSLEEVDKLCEDEPYAGVRCWKWSFPNLKSRHQLGRKAKKMTNTIVEMKKNGNFGEGVGYDRPLEITNYFPAIRGNNGLESRKSVKEDVVLSLKDPKVNKIGVYGIGGVGKTTLVQEVAKQVKDDKLFDTVVMVTVSQTNLEKIQDAIAEQLGLHALKKITSLIGRANCLCERIKKEKTILIILDDLREKIDLHKLGIPSLDAWGKMNPEKVGLPLKDDYKGCKLLMTSRSQDILQKNDDQKNFPLQVLNDEESWSLFEATVGDVVKDDDFRKIATQVAQRCVGLPLLIVTTAMSLKYNEDICYWKDTLNNLKRVDNSRDMNETLCSALEFNFNQLEDEAKKVLLLSGVHGTSILVSDLLKYAIGLGIFKCKNTIEDARNRLSRIIIDLKAYCLLVDDDARLEMIKMHDIVHEVAVSMASEYAFTKINAKLQDWPRKDILERCTHIILEHCCIQKLPERIDCPHLTFLHICSSDNRTLEIPDSFFERVGNLEALDLTGMIMSSLPISLSSLTKLKTLCLDQCFLKDMTGIGALKNLEILSLIHSSVEEFPREIKQLSKLRMLDLSWSGIGTTLPNLLCKLTNIEALYMGDATINWEVESSTTQQRNASLANLGDLTGLTTLEIQIREAWLLPKDIPFEKLERYKVVIGDNWEWSDDKETSRLLKVKLNTNIHWERGIKILIKRVEDLYLDKISGISNVLFELDGEGFPLLRHLHIQNNGEIQHIVNSMERNQTHVLFPKLETMILHNLNNLVKICHGSVTDNSFGKLKIIKVKSCDQLEYLFSVSMVKAFSKLVEIEVSECSSMKKIVSIESTDSGKTIDEKIEFLPLRSLTLQHLPTIDYFCSHELTSSLGIMENLLRDNISMPFFSAKVKFSNLETLKLSSVNLKKIWDDSSAPYLVHNLANLTIENCSGLKYLFSSSMVGRLSNLKQLEISKCDMMEEIIATEEINGVAVGEVVLPNLERVIITEMQNLETVWHPILCPKTLEINKCGKVETICPLYMQAAFTNLETLTVTECSSVKEIFQLGIKDVERTTQLKNITLLQLPQLKHIWSIDPQTGLHFRNLKVVRVEHCDALEYLLPFSIAMDLLQIEQITIKYARKMKEIVSSKEGPLDCPPKFEFIHMTSLVVWTSSELQGVFSKDHSLECPSLKILDVRCCSKWSMFKKQGTTGEGKVLDSNQQVSTQQFPFPLKEVIRNLEELALNYEDASVMVKGQFSEEQFCKLKCLYLSCFADEQAIFPCWLLQNIISLEVMVVDNSSFKEIFQREGQNGIQARIKKLELYQLDELVDICKEGFQINPVLEVLEYLWVEHCSKLKHLVPSSASFSHLTYLEVHNCNGLLYLISSSTARSLIKLRTMRIGACNSLEQVILEENKETLNEIEFSSLRVLELECLPRFKIFCSGKCVLKFPLLTELTVVQCPRMKSFSVSNTSASKLQKILTDKQDGKWCWEGDLNRTVDKILQDKMALRSFHLLEFSEYPELKELWYDQVGHKIFCNLKHLVVRKCTFLSNMLFSSNLVHLLYALEELEVAECDSFEAVFDVKPLDDKAMESMEVSRLKKLTLSGLSNLKRIWNREAGEIISFVNLQIIKVEKCPNLKYLFSPSLCQDLRQLEELHIESCGVEEIVSIEEGLEELKFDFPLLTTLWLLNLTQLTNFYPKRYTLECPSLKILNVRGCEELQIFAFDHLNSQPLREGDIELQTKQALFYIEKVCQNLEVLPLNEKDSMRILNGNYENILFQSVKILRLQHFQETPIKFLNDYIQIFPAMSTLQARCSSFETLFPSEEIVYCSIESLAQIKTLWLFQLEQLKHIWSDDDSASYPLVQNLENLSIIECSGIIRLALPSASFKNLTSLKVKNCKGLTYFMTSCTAKSLINLTSLRICNCEMLEEVVMTDEGESEEEITFESLKYLQLTCLSGFKSFCSGKHTFIFPSLVTLKVIGCHKMQHFSSGVIIAPFLKLVEVEDRKKRWKDDLNTTIKQLFIDKANGGVEGDCKESSSINIDNNQMHQKTVITSSALSFDESKAHEIIDSGKQEMHKLSTPHTGIGTQICEIIETFDQASLNTLKFTKVDAECTPDGSLDMQLHLNEDLLVQATTSIKNDDEDKANEATEKPLIQTTQEAHSSATIQDIEMHDTIQTDQDKESLATTRNRGTQEMCDTIKKPSILVAQNVSISSIMIPNADIDTQNISEIAETPMGQACQNTSSLTKVDTAIGTQDETIERPLVQATHTLSPGVVQDTEKLYSESKNQEMYKTLQKALVPDAQNVLINVERPLVLPTKIAPSTVYDADGSQDLQLHLSENLQVQATTSTMNDEEENTGTKGMHETIQRPLVQNAEDMFIPTLVQDIGTGIRVTHESIADPFVHATQNAWDITIVQKKVVGTQETYKSKRRFSAPDALNVLSPIMVYDTAVDLAPTQASEANSSSTTPIADVCSSFKELDISVQLLPYLEAGVKRHPQVLNWLNTKRRRVFASSSFSLFAEVTRILRTTQRVNLSEDDRNYIRECCTVLQGFGFDDGWISYVHDRIEKCGDEEDLEWKVEEAEAQLESTKKELASVEESLVLLRDKASRLHGYIYLSTLINALLFTILFFIIIYVYLKTN